MHHNAAQNSPINNQLQTLYNTQTATAASHGQNVIIVRDSTRGDVETLLNCAFTSSPSSNFRTEAGTIQWVWDVGFRTTVRGTGTAAAE